MYYSLVEQEVDLHRHLVSQHFFANLRNEARASSIIGNAMLKIMVRMMREPMLEYQSEVKSSYFPVKNNEMFW